MAVPTVVWFAGSVAYQIHFLSGKPWVPFYMGGPRQFDDPDFWKADSRVDIIYKVWLERCLGSGLEFLLI